MPSAGYVEEGGGVLCIVAPHCSGSLIRISPEGTDQHPHSPQPASKVMHKIMRNKLAQFMRDLPNVSAKHVTLYTIHNITSKHYQIQNQILFPGRILGKPENICSTVMSCYASS